MKRNLSGFFTLLFIICHSLFVHSQKTNAPIVERNGKKYYAYTVQKGETIYGLSRSFQVSDQVIYQENPGIEKGLKAGEVIYIPLSKPSSNGGNKPDITIKQENNRFIKHTVQKGETLYGIGRKYEISVDEIVKNNPEVESGLKVGVIINIPTSISIVTEEESEEQTSEMPENIGSNPYQNYANIKDELPSSMACMDNKHTKLEYNIAVLLPLDPNTISDPNATRIAYQYYSGLKLAMSKYEPIKAKINWNFFNTGSKSNDAESKKIIQNPAFQKSDLIIGPLYTSEMAPIIEYSKNNKVPMISPFSRGDEILFGNPYVFKASPSESTYLSSIASMLNQNYKNGKVLLVNTGLKKDSLFYKNLRDTLVLKYKFDSVTVNRNLVYIPKGGNAAAFLKKGVPNICVYPTNKEIAMNTFLSNMNKFTKDNDVSILGDESWFNFRNFDIEHLNNCKINIPVLYKTFAWDSTYNTFINNYKTEYQTEPEFYAFRGYELACLSIDMLEKYGTMLAPCAIYDRNNYLITSFNWKKIPGGGFENKGITLMVLDKYSIKYQYY